MAAGRSVSNCAQASLHPWPRKPRRWRPRPGPVCTVIVPHLRALPRLSNIGSRPGCRMVAPQSATMAACCSSTFATTTASPCRRRPGFAGLPGAEKLRSEWVLGSTAWCAGAGQHRVIRPADRGREVFANDIDCWGHPADLPMPVFGDQEYPEEVRLKYRFLECGAIGCT